MHITYFCSIFGNTEELETTWKFITQGIDEINMSYLYNEILHSNEKA